MSIQDFKRGYIAAALWSSNDDGGTPLDATYGESDIAPETLAAMHADCEAFYAANEQYITTGTLIELQNCTSEEYAGHDFWLTRNGHGCGFWDGGWPDAEGARLDAATKAFGPYTLYVGDDGLIYGMKG